MTTFDAVVVGSGPNGLAAAIELVRSGLRTKLIEAADEIGGGLRTAELTEPGFLHDVCSAIHPSGIASPMFSQLDLDLEWVNPPIPLTHPLGDGRVAVLHRSLDETASLLRNDEDTYRRLMEPIASNIEPLLEDFLAPVSISSATSGSFVKTATIAALPASLLAQRFETEQGKALIAGLAAHSIAPFSAPATTAVGLLLGAIGHSHGWPLVKGGSQNVARALQLEFEGLGGEVETGRLVTDVADVEADSVLLNVMPSAALSIGGDRVEGGQRRRLGRWKPGPGVFKVDWALDAPIPWADEASPHSATVHVGGSFDEIAAAEKAVARGRHADRPFVLLAQQSQFDSSRAPTGKHTAWGYCHVPNGSTRDMTEEIESQVERFAPGFKDRIIARATRNTVEYQAYNPNIVGGDIGGGQFGLRKALQLGASRPYRLGDGLFLCSSATPPGAGVHGMCGYHAARAAITDRR